MTERTMDREETEAEIVARIAAAVRAGVPVEGVLFHGTAEPFEGPLKPGGDGLLWTSDSPVIAQQYIPAAGIESIRSKPMGYEMGSRVMPNLNDVFYGLAAEISGLEVTDVRRDHVGNAVSWAVPDGWPTYADVVRHVEEVLGYEAGRYGSYSLKTVMEGGRDRIMPASWRMQGRLFMALADGFSLKDVRKSDEPDLTMYEHNDFAAFRKAEAEGYDGVVINDFAQTDRYGNFGHLSYGLNGKGLAKARWIAIPAFRFDLNEIHPFPNVTDEIGEWAASAAASAAALAGP